MDLDIKLSSGLGFSIEEQIKQTGTCKQPNKQKINVKLNIKKQTMRKQQK